MQLPQHTSIIDTTELFIQQTSDSYDQQVTFLSYKNRNSLKALAGITPSSAFSFHFSIISRFAFDHELFMEPGLLNKLKVGDAVMVDKQFIANVEKISN